MLKISGSLDGQSFRGKSRVSGSLRMIVGHLNEKEFFRVRGTIDQALRAVVCNWPADFDSGANAQNRSAGTGDERAIPSNLTAAKRSNRIA